MLSTTPDFDRTFQDSTFPGLNNFPKPLDVFYTYTTAFNLATEKKDSVCRSGIEWEAEIRQFLTNLGANQEAAGDGDFVSLLWTFLKKADNIEEYCEGLRVVLSEVQSGTVLPMIEPQNKTSIGFKRYCHIPHFPSQLFH